MGCFDFVPLMAAIPRSPFQMNSFRSIISRAAWLMAR